MSAPHWLPLASCLVLTACGGSSPSPASPHAEHEEHGGHEEHEDHEAAEHHDEGAQSPAVHAFHEALAPLWHADKGPERVTKTCAQAGALHDKAVATKDAELVAATTALVTECEKEGRPEFEARFAAVHESFHGAAKRSKP
jgi:hypothetical protein